MRPADRAWTGDVSRETTERLDVFERTLRAWNQKINLISRHDIEHLWPRHIHDSAQLLAHRPDHATRWVDIGTGGGFPGLIVAILAAEHDPGLRVTLIESDRRKAAFLGAAARACGVTPQIHCARAETLPPQQADVLSARAVAPLKDLLPLAERHLAPNGVALFPKGARSDAELASALESWRFTVQKRPSQTDTAGVILAIQGVCRV